MRNEANMVPRTAQPSCSRFPTGVYVDGSRWYNDIWLLESWERNPRTEVSLQANTEGLSGVRWPCFTWTISYSMHSELAREKMWSRIHLIPLLTAEEDRDLVRRHYADLAREKELMGSNTAVYNSDRYVNLENSFMSTANIFATGRFVRPTYAVTPSRVSK